MAGNTETASDQGEAVCADIWVFVDGQVRFRRRQINRCNGAFSIAIPLGENDRFLTLAATDGGNGIDWIGSCLAIRGWSSSVKADSVRKTAGH